MATSLKEKQLQQRVHKQEKKITRIEFKNSGGSTKKNLDENSRIQMEIQEKIPRLESKNLSANTRKKSLNANPKIKIKILR